MLSVPSPRDAACVIWARGRALGCTPPATIRHQPSFLWPLSPASMQGVSWDVETSDEVGAELKAARLVLWWTKHTMRSGFWHSSWAKLAWNFPLQCFVFLKENVISVQSKTSRGDRSVSLFIFRNTWLEYFESDAAIPVEMITLGQHSPTASSVWNHSVLTNIAMNTLMSSGTGLVPSLYREKCLTSSACMKYGPGISQALLCPPRLWLLRTWSQPPMHRLGVLKWQDTQKLQPWEAAKQCWIIHGAMAHTDTTWCTSEPTLSPAASCRPGHRAGGKLVAQ